MSEADPRLAEAKSGAEECRFADRYLNLMERAGGRPAWGDSVYDERLNKPAYPKFNRTPHIVYFYYVRFDTDDKLRVDHYRYVDGDIDDPNRPPAWAEILPSALPGIAQDLVTNARKRRPDNPRPDRDRNFENIKWGRKCYIMIFVDEANWKLHKKGASLDGVRFSELGLPNHTFYDAMDFDVTVTNATTGKTDQRTAIAFINHMKDANGDDLGRVDEEFKFELIFDVSFADPASPNVMTVIFDPGGTNMGPPDPPPQP